MWSNIYKLCIKLKYEKLQDKTLFLCSDLIKKKELANCIENGRIVSKINKQKKLK